MRGSIPTGIPENPAAVVDLLLHAETRGPQKLTDCLDTLDPDQTRAALRTLLVRTNSERGMTVREALASPGRAERAEERRQIIRGGNR